MATNGKDIELGILHEEGQDSCDDGREYECQIDKEYGNGINHPASGCMVSNMTVQQVGDHERLDVGEATSGRVETSNKQHRLRRAVSDIQFKAHMAPVHLDRKKYTCWGTIGQAYQALGIVFGGLGTSPLYVYPSVNLSNPQEEDYLGLMSLIFWTLTLIAFVKYVLIVIRADDRGEGGTFALYSLLHRHASVDQKDTAASDSETTHSSGQIHDKVHSLLKNSRTAQIILFIVVMLGTCLVIGDGILTPAISVLSAMAGIQSEDESLPPAVVTWVSAIILVVVFMLQQFGTHRVSWLFSPILLVWFVTTPLVGIYNIAAHYPSVFKAVSPHYIIKYFIRNKKQGWVSLGGAVLCITGAEAMFADLGHFNRRAIQVGFIAVLYPSCLLTYAGQTAYLIRHPMDHQNAFFKSIPQPVYWPMFIVATLSAIVASQSLITATFSITKQTIALGCFPRVKMVHTSADQEGQVYSPEVNYVLMILCVAVVLGFRNSTTVGNAFGVAVLGVMFISTLLVTVVMLMVWKLPWPLAFLFLSVFGSIEGVYFTAVLNKVPQGGWVPFAFAAFFLCISLTWSYGRQKKHTYEKNHKISLDSLGALLSSAGMQRVPGICFFYTDLVHGVPPIISHYVKNVRTLHQVLVFTTFRFIPVRTVLPEERFLVGRVGFKGVYRCVARYGYQDIIDCEGDEFKSQAIQSLRSYLQSEDQMELSTHQISNGTTDLQSPSLKNFAEMYDAEDLAELESATSHTAVYVVGKITVRTSSHTGWLGHIIIDKVYTLLRLISRSTIKELKIPPANYLEELLSLFCCDFAMSCLLIARKACFCGKHLVEMSPNILIL